MERTVTRSITRYTRVSEYSVRSRSSAEMRAMISLALFSRSISCWVSAPLPELMDRKKRDIMERKGDKEDENKRQKQQKESNAAAL